MSSCISQSKCFNIEKGSTSYTIFQYKFGDRYHKKLLFLFVFSTYLPTFLLKFRSRQLVGCGIKFCIQGLPTRHTFDGPCYPKNKKYLKNVMMMSSSHFSDISCFWGSGVHQKYIEWALVGCGI